MMYIIMIFVADIEAQRVVPLSALATYGYTVILP